MKGGGYENDQENQNQETTVSWINHVDEHTAHFQDSDILLMLSLTLAPKPSLQPRWTRLPCLPNRSLPTTLQQPDQLPQHPERPGSPFPCSPHSEAFTVISEWAPGSAGGCQAPRSSHPPPLALASSPTAQLYSNSPEGVQTHGEGLRPTRLPPTLVPDHEFKLSPVLPTDWV